MISKAQMCRESGRAFDLNQGTATQVAAKYGPMKPELLAKFDRRVPRYTSYPTAPHFHTGVGADTYVRWLDEIPSDTRLSLYVPVPLCDSLCWFCGCHTKLVKRYAPVAQYLGLLRREIDLVAERLISRLPIGHIHWGGGSPNILAPQDVEGLADTLRQRFDILPNAEFAVEIDPRGLSPALVEALARSGVNRVSLGVQDLNPEVQRAVNRRQPLEVTAKAINRLRGAGIDAINIDLMYGLPFQTVKRMSTTVEAVLGLDARRLAVFGYAHVPWMKTHQRLIDEAALPTPAERLAQFEAAAGRLEDAGYVAIGLDHFADPEDALAVARREGRLRRNFQGYTTDDAPVLLGFGASAISALPQGYVQNTTSIHAYREAIDRGGLAAARGIVLGDEDRLRRAVIERLMCDLGVDLAELCRRYDRMPDHFAAELAALVPMAADGLLTVEDNRIRVSSEARPYLRTVCSAFDLYLQGGETRHAQAV